MKTFEIIKTGIGQGIYTVMIDDEDYEKVMKIKWQISVKNKGSLFYVKTTTSIKQGRRRELSLHRYLLGNNGNLHIDHIDGNGLNNQKNNLRFCTHLENCQNRGLRRNKTCQYKGVTYEKHIKKYRSRIRVNKVLIDLGKYLTEIEAATAYNKAALIYFGQYARLNVV